MKSVSDTELADLERRATDSSDLAKQLKAQQQLTELLAAEIAGQRNKEYVVYDIRLGDQKFVLQHDEKEQLVKQANMARLSIQRCVRHQASEGLRCPNGCSESFKRWYWALRESPLQQVASALWDKLDAFARQNTSKPMDDLNVEALIQAFESKQMETKPWQKNR